MKTSQPTAKLLALLTDYVHCFRSPIMGLGVVAQLNAEGLYAEVLGNSRSMDTQEACDRAARRYLPAGYAQNVASQNAYFVRKLAA